jgi:hypothetical protein
MYKSSKPIALQKPKVTPGVTIQRLWYILFGSSYDRAWYNKVIKVLGEAVLILPNIVHAMDTG